MWKHHAQVRAATRSSCCIGIIIVVSIGGLVEIAPLFYLESTIEKVKGVRPYTPLEQAGRDIYVREGCYVCHSQMIRPLRDEVERYGHYSLAAESMYDHPFQWGSKRTGPGPGAGRRQVLRRLAPRPPDRPALGGAGIDHAALRASWRRPTSTTAIIEQQLAALQRGRRALHRRRRSPTPRPTSRPRPTPSPARPRTLKKRYGAKVAQRDFDGDPGAADRDGRPDRLPADAGHHGRFPHLQGRRPGEPAMSGLTYEAVARFAQQGGTVYFVA